MGALGQIAQIILTVAFSIVVIALIVRLLAILGQADFRNPLAGTILQITNPFVRPFYKVMPPIGRFDQASLLVLWIAQFVFGLLLVGILSGFDVAIANIAQLAIWSILAVAGSILMVLRWSMIIVAIGSWLTMGQYNPLLAFLTRIIEPYIGPFRKLNLQIGMLDLSLLIGFVVIYIIELVVIGTIAQAINYPGGLFIGL